MNEIIKIEEHDGVQFVNARELHSNLGVGKIFAAWIKERIEKYGFVEGEDYKTCFPNLESETQGGQNKVDYLISVSMAKELAMVENNDKGREVRQYLIKIEQAWNTPELIFARALQMANNTIETFKHRAIEAERKNAVLMHTRKLYTATEVAKELGLRSAQELNEKLQERGVQFKQNGTWVPCADYSDLGYFSIKQNVLDNGTVIYDRKITQDGRAFIVDLLKV